MFSLDKIVRPNILALKPYSSARSEFSSNDGVFLDANENPFGNLNRYPDPLQTKLKEKLAKLKGFSTQNIFIGNGSDEVIDLAFRIFCEPGKDRALTFTPTYGMYEVAAAINNVELQGLPLTSNFDIDLQECKTALQDPALKLIFICSPNNPSGNSFNRQSVEFLLKNFHGIVFIDEAYIDFSPKNSFTDLLEEYPNLIVSQTLSKAWGLASARVGFAIANPDIIALFNKVKPPYNVSSLNQQAALAALSEKEVFDRNLQSILSEKERLIQELAQQKSVLKIHPSDANFLLIEVTDANRIYKELVNQKIIVRNRHQLVNNCIRISIGTPKENKELITAFNTINP